MHKFCVYMILNLINGKIYIGKTCNSNKRWVDHQSDARSHTKNRKYPIHCAMAKYGIENFNFTPFHWFEKEDDAFGAERYWIRHFQSKNPRCGYNVTDGGEGASGVIFTEERKTKISISLTGKKKSPETVEKQAAKLRGIPRPPEVRAKISASHIGLTHTEESKRKISKGKKGQVPTNIEQLRAINTGKPLSEEHRNKISKAKKGVPFTEEHIRNIIVAKEKNGTMPRGEKNPFYGKHHTEEVKTLSRGENNKHAKLVEAQVREIRKLYETGEYTQTELAEKYGVSRKGISHIINRTTWAHIE
jgi:hypothetical protein